MRNNNSNSLKYFTTNIVIILFCSFSYGTLIDDGLWLSGQIDGNWTNDYQMNTTAYGGNTYFYYGLSATGDYSNAAFLFQNSSFGNKWNDISSNKNSINTYIWNNSSGADNHISDDVINGKYYYCFGNWER